MNKLKKIFMFALNHKIISVIVILAVIGGGYYWYKYASQNSGKVSYLTTPAEKGTIVSSISGSGQVSASSQIDLKSKVSENVVYVGVKNGQQIKTGTLLMQFDTANTQKAVRNAQISLDNAKLSLLKLAGGNDIIVPLNKQQAEDNLVKAHNDGFNTISNIFLDLPGIITGLKDILFGEDINKYNQNIDYYAGSYAYYTQQDSDKLSKYKNDIYNSYQKALASYNKNFDSYKSISRYDDSNKIELMINETYLTAQDISDAVKNTNSLIQFYKDLFTTYQLTINPIVNTHLASLNTYTGKLNTGLSNLLSIQSTIKNTKTAVVNSDLDLQSQNLSLKQAENSLADARANLADSYIYAPYAGVVANVVFNKGDSASSGAVAVTLITNQSITKIPFNEVDIIKVKVGQKATLTFDAIDGLSIVGQVAEIDTLGTVTQGVVNYNVKIIFDTQNSRVKPGMSVTADVITDVRQNVIIVPNSAVKQSGNQKYVEFLVNGKPEQKNVEIGISNDTDAEIISGLKEGDNVITQTVTQGATSSTQTQNSLFRIPSIGGGSGFRGSGGGAPPR